MKPFLAKYIPWSLVGLRFCLGPAMPLVAWQVPNPQGWMGGMLVAGFLSDVFDGILARRWGTATGKLRVADTSVDTVFYIGVAVALGLRHWPEIHARLAPLAGLAAMEAIRFLFDFWKYGRISSYHSYLAKSWGIVLVVATVSALCFDAAYWLLSLAIVWGIVCDAEGLTMSLLLPQWTHDVKSLGVAMRLRAQQLARTT